MKEYFLNKKFLLATLALSTVVVLCVSTSYKLLSSKIIIEDANINSGLLLAAILIIVSISYLYSVIVMIRQYVVYSKSAFTITGEGIQNTIVGMNLLAFIFVAPIKEIPWDAIKSIEKTQGFYIAKLDLKKVQAGPIAKLTIKMTGYKFCSSFLSGSIDDEECILSRLTVSE